MHDELTAAERNVHGLREDAEFLAAEAWRAQQRDASFRETMQWCADLLESDPLTPEVLQSVIRALRCGEKPNPIRKYPKPQQ